MPSSDGVALVDHVKSLGVILQLFVIRLTKLVKQCSQCISAAALLRGQGLH